ncbi:hypothetical protein TNCV_4348911 [Trichonephila clavipes]|nr:hypothetical protein TNCV_4348911 [Trichonephila clavipes]
MLIQPASSQPGLVRGTVVLLENSLTVRVTEQQKRMEMITQQHYLPNCIEGGWSSCAAEQFHSDASLEAVDRRAPNNSKNWQWTKEGDVSTRRLTPALHGSE